MARQDINRSGEMEVFTRVVDLGGFSAAARAFRMTPSAVSKLVARLEARLGVRLINRSTRKLQLTPEGSAYYDRAIRILDEIETAEREAAIGATPRGRVRVNTSVPFGLHWLLPLLPGFLARYPGVNVDVALTDTVVDLMEERADIAIRVGPLRESRLLVRKLGESRMVVTASASYLKQRGTPRTPSDLAKHNMLGFCFAKQVDGWPFRDKRGEIITIAPSGSVLVSDGEAMQQLTVAGAGLSRLSRFHVDQDIKAGRLVPVLEDFNPGDLEPIHAVFVGHGGQLPARVRALLDYLVENVRL
ncbi:MAG TPA: LysR family transcriptional regulator [Afipia sp.]